MSVVASDAEPPTLSFVPCAEDALGGVPRHSSSIQSILCDVGRRLLIAQARLQRLEATPSVERTDEARKGLQNEALSCHELLWGSREAVHDSGRREWLETALVLLEVQQSLKEAFRWVLDGEGKGTRGGNRWVLWENHQRRIDFLTLRTTAVKPEQRGGYMVMEPMTYIDIVKMDGSAFAYRVRLWLRCGELTQDSFPDIERHCVNPQICSGEPCALIRQLINSTVSSSTHDAIVGALRFRMLMELCLVRLADAPRCLFMWRLFSESLSYLAHCASKGDAMRTPGVAARAVIGHMHAYITSHLIPYLELRDRHVESLRGTMARGARALLVRDTEAWACASSFGDSPSCAMYNAMKDICCYAEATGSQGNLLLPCEAEGSEAALEAPSSSYHHETLRNVLSSSSARRSGVEHFVTRFFLQDPMHAFERSGVQAARPCEDMK